MTPRPSASRRALLGASAAALAAGAWPFAAHAQSGTVKFILPNATGSGVDAITRAASTALGKALNANVVVDNQPGAGGVVGLQALARSAPDGNTLSVVSNNVVIFPSVLKSLPFDMPGDFTPIAVVGATPMVLVVNPSKVQATNHKEFQAALKAKPGQYNFASGGNGTILHLASELYLDEAGVTAKHIPYKGVGPMVTDMIGGQVDFGTAALPSLQAHIKSGALRPIGMLSPQRTPAAPEIPTFAEQGLKLRRRSLVRRHRPQGHAARDGEEGPRSRRRRLRRPGREGSDGQAGQHHQHQHDRTGATGVPQGTGEVRGAGEEGGPRAAVSARVPRSNRSFVIPAKAGIQGFRVGWQGGGRCGFAPPRE
jgi:tripartite-type tricarboxylate transporter receptor subunit TctC